MSQDIQSRNWLLTINNPKDNDLSHETVKEILEQFKLRYWCMADEIGESGTYHTHIFLSSSSPIRFSTIKKRFPTAHIDKAVGSPQDNKNYIFKSGKWAETDKAETSVEGTFEEWGEMPSDGRKTESLESLVEDLKNGKRTGEIVEEKPNFGFRVKEIDNLRQALLVERENENFRDVKAIYIFGTNSTDRTKWIYSEHSPAEICRITSYKRSGNGVYFDSYTGQNVLVFEEFNSQVDIEEMIAYLDIFPIQLPARYSDKVACYTKVYISSSLPLLAQYQNIQMKRPELWQAFQKKIDRLLEMSSDGSIKEIKLNERND